MTYCMFGRRFYQCISNGILLVPIVSCCLVSFFMSCVVCYVIDYFVWRTQLYIKKEKYTNTSTANH